MNCSLALQRVMFSFSFLKEGKAPLKLKTIRTNKKGRSDFCLFVFLTLEIDYEA